MKLGFLDAFDFFTGVPDSLLKPLCSYVMDRFGIGPGHIIAANEGNAVGLAAGYHLATGRVPVVYLQNSGLGNIINPVASLMNGRVYGIPCVFIVGWRGEPGVHDEPQHVFQGEVTLRLLEDMDIRTFVISRDTTEDEAARALAEFRPLLDAGKQVAFVVRKGALEYDGKTVYHNDYTLTREEAIRRVTAAAGPEDVIVSTTGKASRELFEIREARGEGHERDFLTVGSMGHSSSIALGIALRQPHRRVFILDGDGAVLMHMGSLALMGANRPGNVIHLVLNNSAHETVGGMPTVAGQMNLPQVALGCGYPHAACVSDASSLDAALAQAMARRELTLLEVKCALGSRPDLGRPTTTAVENKRALMGKLLANGASQ